jgi:hypothetical protein
LLLAARSVQVSPDAAAGETEAAGATTGPFFSSLLPVLRIACVAGAARTTPLPPALTLPPFARDATDVGVSSRVAGSVRRPMLSSLANEWWQKVVGENIGHVQKGLLSSRLPKSRTDRRNCNSSGTSTTDPRRTSPNIAAARSAVAAVIAGRELMSAIFSRPWQAYTVQQPGT